MILNDVTITYSDGECGNITSAYSIEFHNALLNLVCTHGVNLSIPMKNIKTIHIERREVDVRTEDEA